MQYCTSSFYLHTVHFRRHHVSLPPPSTQPSSTDDPSILTFDMHVANIIHAPSGTLNRASSIAASRQTICNSLWHLNP